MNREFKAYENKNSKSSLFNNKKIPSDDSIHGLYRRVNLLESSSNLLSQPLIIEDTAVDTESNLWYVVLQKNLYRLGLPTDMFEECFKGAERFTLKEAYEKYSDKPAETIRARIYDNLGVKFKRIAKGIYCTVESENEKCIVLEGDGQDLSIIEDNSIDCIFTDHPWLDIKSNKGGTRAFAVYDCFKYTLDDFKEKARVLKDGCFLVEVLPAENENNYEYLYQIKQYAKEAGFIYYSKVAWKKGTFVSNTGRKAKNTQDIMIFSKGKARNMRIDTKRTEQTGKLTYMSGCKGMLPTMFDVQPVSKKNRIHQSELPVSLCEQILEFLIYEGEVVLDSFAGSGAVGEAALNLKRNCILIEILKDNIEKIKKRFENNVLMKTAMEW